ncbi:MAG: MBL fold metallo-hydrolase [Alphaproteobacteria bacterium]|jgi:phosphoribosyl 1,2-cyclic phosphodiesterase|nr:MBL fold metallo-hydrolase [Alphaproteobacteria bacterium]
MYLPGNEFEVLGASHGNITMRELISAQMDGVYFPINIREFGSRVYFHDLMEGEYEISNIIVRTMLLSHPGNCLGYRVQYNGRAICYVTDNEMYNADSPFYNAHYVEKLTEFVREADALITDCTYTDDEYLSKIGWGHSSIGQVTDLAHNAEVKNLYLFHHDPDQTDTDIDHKLETVAKALEERGSKTKVVAPAESQSFTI